MTTPKGKSEIKKTTGSKVKCFKKSLSFVFFFLFCLRPSVAIRNVDYRPALAKSLVKFFCSASLTSMAYCDWDDGLTFRRPVSNAGVRAASRQACGSAAVR